MKPEVAYCIIVEDEPLAQKVLETYISRVSTLKLVSKYDRLEDAFSILTTDEVDVIFLDLNLKDESGMTLLTALGESSRRIYYVIVTSAITLSDFEKEHRSTGGNVVIIDYLSKPFSFDRFVKATEQLKKGRKK
jgi:two-component system, LytTR family, response regulator